MAVVVGFIPTDVGFAALDAARTEAERRGGPLILVNVVRDGVEDDPRGVPPGRVRGEGGVTQDVHVADSTTWTSCGGSGSALERSGRDVGDEVPRADEEDPDEGDHADHGAGHDHPVRAVQCR